MNKPDYITTNDWNLITSKYDNLDVILDKIKNNYPIQYLIGYVDFYGYHINVDENVLIPRFETETLVEKTINYLKELHLTSARVLEIGTGSGCISIALKKELPNLNITAIDISKNALNVAKSNAELNNVDINFIEADVFDYEVSSKYDVIISNPPYIAYDMEVSPNTKAEPQNAIFADHNGLIFYEHILNQSNWVNEHHLLAFEIGYEQGEALKNIAANNFSDNTIKIEQDLSNRDRYLFVYK